MKVTKKRIMFKAVILTMLMSAMLYETIFASGIQGLKLFSGGMQFLNDATVAAMVVLPVVCGLLLIVFNAFKAGADQQDQIMWSKRIKMVIKCLIFGEGGVAIVNMIVGYIA